MPREIKFRAWSKYEERMIPWEEIEAGTRFYLCQNWESAKDAGLTFMQYTGLKANGVEVYEGDIVQLLNVEDGEERVRSSVTFEDGAFVIYKGTDRLLLGSCSFTLVGNLYENCDLLSKPSTWNDAGDVNHDLYGDRSIG